MPLNHELFSEGKIMLSGGCFFYPESGGVEYTPWKINMEP